MKTWKVYKREGDKIVALQKNDEVFRLNDRVCWNYLRGCEIDHFTIKEFKEEGGKLYVDHVEHHNKTSQGKWIEMQYWEDHNYDYRHYNKVYMQKHDEGYESSNLSEEEFERMQRESPQLPDDVTYTKVQHEWNKQQVDQYFNENKATEKMVQEDMEAMKKSDIITHMAKDIAGKESPELEQKLREFYSQTPYADSLIDGSTFRNAPQQNPDGTWPWKQPEVSLTGPKGTTKEQIPVPVYTSLEQILKEIKETVSDPDVQGGGYSRRVSSVIEKLQKTIDAQKYLQDGRV